MTLTKALLADIEKRVAIVHSIPIGPNDPPTLADALAQDVTTLLDAYKHCGKENCMGWRQPETANWVREERLLAAQKALDDMDRAFCRLENFLSQLRSEATRGLTRTKTTEQAHVFRGQRSVLDKCLLRVQQVRARLARED